MSQSASHISHPVHPPKLLVPVLAGLIGLTAVAVDIMLPALPVMAQDFSTDVGAMQRTVVMFMLGFGVGQLLWGLLAERYGRRPVVIFGLFAFVVSSAACALAPDYHSMVLLRVLQGISSAVGTVLSRTLVRDFFEGARAAQVMSTLMMVMAVAPMLAPMVGGLLLPWGGWESLFYATAATGGAVWLGCLMELPETRGPDPGALAMSRWVPWYVTFFRTPACLWGALLTGVAFSGLFAFITGSSAVIIGHYGIPAQHFGFYFAVAAGSLMVSANLNRRWVMQLGIGGAMRRGLMLMLAGAVLLQPLVWSEVGGLPLFLVGFSVHVLGLGLVMPNATVTALHPVPHMAGVASSLIGAIQMLVAASASALLSVLQDGTATGIAVVVSLVALSSFALAQGIKRHLPVPPTP